MAQYKSQQELVKAIDANLEALEAGKLTANELENHLDLVRELYERTLILRYKIFEKSVDLDQKKPTIIEAQIEDKIESEEISVNLDTEEEVPSIDFSLFDENDEEKAETHYESEEVIDETPIVNESHIKSPTETNESIEEEIIKPASEDTSSEINTKFIKRFDVIQNDIRGQFGFAKLDTLTGSFGLNERLQYINELFNGSSETFSEAVKHLDSLPGIDEAKKVTEKISVENEWDLDSETVEEFVQKLCRRYA